MKVSLNWLKDWIQFTETDTQKLVKILTDSTSEVEEVIEQGKGLEKVFVGQILEITAHPDADKMRVTKTQVGSEVYQIVCGANNIEVGQKVPVALVGAMLPGGFEIKKADKRGVESCGMICSETELGLAESSEGILALPPEAPIGMPITEYLGLDDTILDIENTTITNRPDLFSQRGYVREFTAIGLAEWKDKEAFESALRSAAADQCDKDFPLNITIEKSEICPRMCGVYIKNFKVEASPEWMQKRLQACEVRPINNLVDITNYVMLEIGMPLHAFDLRSIDGKKVVMRTSKQGEKVTTLDGIERSLPENVIILQDEKKIFDLCGIMGGENSGVTESTTEVWLHAPIYHPTLIRRASVALSHRTDASVIYEKRVPSVLAMQGLSRAVELMQELCPQVEIASKVLDIDNDLEKTRILTMAKSHLYRILGKEIEDAFVENTLTNLGFTVKTQGEKFEIIVPAFRFKDINIPEDIIEEVIRIYGLAHIGDELPTMQMQRSEPSPGFRMEQKIKNILAETAYEVVNFSFLGKKLLERTGFSTWEKLIEVANPISEDLNLMRPLLLPYLLEKLENNRLEEEAFSLFEIGRVFSKLMEGRERKQMAYIAYNSDFLKVKGVLEELSLEMGIVLQILPAKEAHTCAHSGQIADILFQGKRIGSLFTLHPKIAKEFHLNKPVVAFEFRLDAILSAQQKPATYKEFNRLPKVERDQNFILEKMVLTGEFIRKISKASPLLQSIEVVDVYEGEHVEVGFKSITIRAVYQAVDRTLTDAEVDMAHKELVAQAEKQGAKLRS